MWQEEAVRGVAALLECEAVVKSLLVIGSCTTPEEMDALSDVDFVVILETAALPRFAENATWLAPVGNVYTCARSQSGVFPSLRVFLHEGRRLDFLFVPFEQLAAFMAWPKNPMRYGVKAIFSRITAPLSPPTWPDLPPVGAPPLATIEAMANDFRFKAMMAVSKVARDDLLVATHLTLHMLADCVVLALMARDTETATDHHRDGGRWNGLIEGIPVISDPGDAESLLATIEQAARFFDRMARRLGADYQPQIEPLLRWIQVARRHRDGKRRP